MSVMIFKSLPPLTSQRVQTTSLTRASAQVKKVASDLNADAAKVRVLRLRVHAAVVAGEMRAQLPSSQGRPRLPSMIPAPIPTAAVRLPQALPVAGIDLDPALWRKLDYSSYGDPRSKSTTPSNGSGEGGGVGNGKGTGIGEGDGPGFGPGRDGGIGGGSKKPGGGGIGGSDGDKPDDDDRIAFTSRLR